MAAENNAFFYVGTFRRVNGGFVKIVDIFNLEGKIKDFKPKEELHLEKIEHKGKEYFAAFLRDDIYEQLIQPIASCLN